MQLEILLQQVSAIQIKYEKIAEVTGENFNIFRILKLETNEVKMHSAFLVELLNAKGSHGQKDVFLKLFIKLQIDKGKQHEVFLSFDTLASEAIPEKFIDSNQNDGTEGGKIDILIKENDSGKAIIIENKINAGDQLKQLTRYNKAYKEAPIFYLTLDGKKPSDDSRGDLKEDSNYFCISYKYDILNWLKECLKEAVTHPILRETISQYINLIKYLTNQTLYDNMANDIASLISKNANYVDSFYAIKKVENEIKNMLMEQFKTSIINIGKELQEKKDKEKLKIKACLDSEEFKAALFVECGLWRGFMIVFEFGKDWDTAKFGIRRIDKNIPIDTRIINIFKNKFSYMTFQTSDDFPVSSKFESWDVWDKLLPEIANRRTEAKVKETLNNFISSVLDIDFSQIQ